MGNSTAGMVAPRPHKCQPEISQYLMFRYAKDGGTTKEKGEVERQLDPRFVGRACEAVNQPESTEPLCICFALQN